MENSEKTPEHLETKQAETTISKFWAGLEQKAADSIVPTPEEAAKKWWDSLDEHDSDIPPLERDDLEDAIKQTNPVVESTDSDINLDDLEEGGKYHDTEPIDPWSFGGEDDYLARVEKTDDAEYPSTYEERLKKTPCEGDKGHWEGERGESKYIPTDPEIIDILKKYGLDGIEYKNGVPDFSKVSESTVEIDNMTDNRKSNFKQCDEKCAEKWNKEGRDGKTDWTDRDVANWRRENGYCWHERNDMKTCDLVPTKINSYFGHLGGVGEYNKTKLKDGGFDE